MKDKIRPYKVWRRVFPKIKLRQGMYVKCAEGRKKEGFLLGRIREIHNYGHLYPSSYKTLELESVPRSIWKRENTVMYEVTETEYIEWGTKEWKKRGFITIILNGRWIRLTKEQAEPLLKAFGVK